MSRFDAFTLLSIEDPNYLMKVFFKSPFSCLGLARWLPVNAGDVARRYIKDPTLLKFIDIECFCWSVMPADLTPMINAGMVFSDRHYGGINYPKGGVGIIAEKLVKGIENFKGEIRYRAKVKKIIFENGKAIGGKAWKIRCANPNKTQLYSIVDVWVSQRSGAIVRMNAYNQKRRIIKSFEVDSIQQIKGDWFVETMIVRTYPDDAKSKPTSSFLKLVPKK